MESKFSAVFSKSHDVLSTCLSSASDLNTSAKRVINLLTKWKQNARHLLKKGLQISQSDTVSRSVIPKIGSPVRLPGSSIH
jgi:hypothetical protein